MANLVDEIGNRYSRLLVIDQAENNKQGCARWLCICDCGKQHIIVGYSLRRGDTKSCGCLQKEVVKKVRSLPEREANFRDYIRTAKRQAKYRNIDWFLTDNYVQTLNKKLCFYCGTKPSSVYRKSPNGDYIYNGIDRLDNELGYMIGNVVPCCAACNRAKDIMLAGEFITKAKKIAIRFTYV